MEERLHVFLASFTDVEDLVFFCPIDNRMYTMNIHEPQKR